MAYTLWCRCIDLFILPQPITKANALRASMTAELRTCHNLPLAGTRSAISATNLTFYLWLVPAMKHRVHVLCDAILHNFML